MSLSKTLYPLSAKYYPERQETLGSITSNKHFGQFNLCNGSRGVASLKFKVVSTHFVEHAECMRKRNIYKQRGPRCDTAKCGVSSGSALFAKINTLLVMVDYKKLYMIRQALW